MLFLVLHQLGEAQALLQRARASVRLAHDRGGQPQPDPEGVRPGARLLDLVDVLAREQHVHAHGDLALHHPLHRALEAREAPGRSSVTRLIASSSIP